MRGPPVLRTASAEADRKNWCCGYCDPLQGRMVPTACR